MPRVKNVGKYEIHPGSRFFLYMNDLQRVAAPGAARGVGTRMYTPKVLLLILMSVEFVAVAVTGSFANRDHNNRYESSRV